METELSRTNFATEQNEWLGKHCTDFIDKDSWYLQLVDYHVWVAMLEQFQELKPKPQNVTDALKAALQTGMICLHDETIR